MSSRRNAGSITYPEITSQRLHGLAWAARIRRNLRLARACPDQPTITGRSRLTPDSIQASISPHIMNEAAKKRRPQSRPAARSTLFLSSVMIAPFLEIDRDGAPKKMANVIGAANPVWRRITALPCWGEVRHRFDKSKPYAFGPSSTICLNSASLASMLGERGETDLTWVVGKRLSATLRAI